MNTDIKTSQAGFTLIEFIVALVVAAIMAAMVAAYFSNASTQNSIPIERLMNSSTLNRLWKISSPTITGST